MKYNIFYRLIVIIIVVLFLFVSCATTIPKEALQLSKESLKDRQLQTRRFDTDEKTLLSASAAVLQDLGFTINEAKLIWVLLPVPKNVMPQAQDRLLALS